MKVLFVCIGNTCRSPMAKGIFEDLVRNDNDFECDSAGIACDGDEPAAKEAIEVCKEIGVDISNHKSKKITSIPALNSFDLYIVMTHEHYVMLKLLRVKEDKIKILDNGILDPYSMDEDMYRKTRDQIKKSLEMLYNDLIDQNKSNG